MRRTPLNIMSSGCPGRGVYFCTLIVIANFRTLPFSNMSCMMGLKWSSFWNFLILYTFFPISPRFIAWIGWRRPMGWVFNDGFSQWRSFMGWVGSRTNSTPRTTFPYRTSSPPRKTSTFPIISLRNQSIYNIIRWVVGTMGQTNRWPRVWCSKYYFLMLFIALEHSKLFLFVIL